MKETGIARFHLVVLYTFYIHYTALEKNEETSSDLF